MTTVVNGRFLPQRQGGLQRTARSMLEALADLTPLEVVSPQADPLADTVVRAPSGRAGGQVWEQLLLPRHAAGRPLLSLANTAPLISSRSTVWVHDLAPLVGPQWFRPSMRAYGRLVLTAARRAALVVTVSEAVKRELRARGVTRVEVVSPAVDPCFFPDHCGGEQEPYVVLVGWADPRKDLATAVAAHRAVVKHQPHRLVLLGSPRGVFAPVPAPDLPSVTVLPHVSDVELRQLLTGATALLYPSRYEGFGLPPLEAAACGTPSLVSDLPVLRESTQGQATFVPAGDVDAWTKALRQALEEPTRVAPVTDRTWSAAAAELAALMA